MTLREGGLRFSCARASRERRRSSSSSFSSVTKIILLLVVRCGRTPHPPRRRRQVDFQGGRSFLGKGFVAHLAGDGAIRNWSPSVLSNPGGPHKVDRIIGRQRLKASAKVTTSRTYSPGRRAQLAFKHSSPSRPLKLST